MDKQESTGWAYGILTDTQHLDPAGIVHGGLLMSLMDHALSSIAASAQQFLKVTGRVTGATSTMVFASGELSVEDRILMSASALLKTLRKSHAGSKGP